MNATCSTESDIRTATMGTPVVRRFTQAALVGLLVIGATACMKESNRSDSSSTDSSTRPAPSRDVIVPEAPAAEAPTVAAVQVAATPVAEVQVVPAAVAVPEVAETLEAVTASNEDDRTPAPIFDPGPHHVDWEEDLSTASIVAPGHPDWDGSTHFDPGEYDNSDPLQESPIPGPVTDPLPDVDGDGVIDFDYENDEGDPYFDYSVTTEAVDAD